MSPYLVPGPCAQTSCPDLTEFTLELLEGSASSMDLETDPKRERGCVDARESGLWNKRQQAKICNAHVNVRQSALHH